MNTSLNHGSAKIYQFPVGGRSAVGGRGHDETKSCRRSCFVPRQRSCVRGSWYHEAAIQESKPVRER